MIRDNSATAVAMVFAGAGSRADSADTAFTNPAGLTRLALPEVEMGLVTILTSLKFHGGASVHGAPIPGGNGGDAGNTAPIPNLYWAFGINDRLKAGIAVSTPFGNSTEYDSTWAGRYLAIKTEALSVDINPNIAFKLNDSLAIGGGFSAQYLKIDASSAIAQFLILAPTAPDASYRFKADDWAFGFNLGALWDAGHGTRIGIAYRSGIDHRIEGSLDFTGASPFLGVVNGPASAKLRLPATADVSITHEFTPDFSLSADMQFTHWSVFDQVVIESGNRPLVNEERFRDAWMLALGGIYRLDQDWSLMGGIAWDQTPVTDQFRAVSLPDSTRHLVGVGAKYRLSDAITIAAGYQHSFAFAHPSMDKSANATDSLTHAVVLHGNYDVNFDLFALSVHYKY
jgi:long-chain fatty acid transport protein